MGRQPSRRPRPVGGSLGARRCISGHGHKRRHVLHGSLTVGSGPYDLSARYRNVPPANLGPSARVPRNRGIDLRHGIRVDLRAPTAFRNALAGLAERH